MNSEPKYHLCAVDGGGTGCRVILAAGSGRVLARSSGGPANFTTDPEQASQNVQAAIQEAAAQLGPDAPPLSCLVAHIGLAGIMGPEDAEALSASLGLGVCEVTDDRVTSAIGALGGQDGVLLAIGTGSFAAVRRGAQMQFLGGWGFNAGDQASGAWLGRAVLEQSLLAEDGLADHSALTQQILVQFDTVPGHISGFAARAAPSDFAALAPLVISAAQKGDAVGRALMARGADYLNAVLKRAQISETSPICLSGGIGPHYGSYLEQAYQDRIISAKGTALDGALRLAKDRLTQLEALSSSPKSGPARP